MSTLYTSIQTLWGFLNQLRMLNVIVKKINYVKFLQGLSLEMENVL